MKVMLKYQLIFLLTVLVITSLVGCGGSGGNGGGGGIDDPAPANTKTTLVSLSTQDGMVNSGLGIDNNVQTAYTGESGDNTDLYGFVGFNVSSIPDDAVVVSATLRICQATDHTGDPYTDLGNVQVNHIQFSNLSDIVTNINALLSQPSIGTLSTSYTANTYRELNVTASVQADITSSTVTYSQFLFYHATKSGDNDGVAENSNWYMSETPTVYKPRLVIIYHQ